MRGVIDVTAPFKGQKGILEGLAVVMHAHILICWVATVYPPYYALGFVH